MNAAGLSSRPRVSMFRRHRLGQLPRRASGWLVAALGLSGVIAGCGGSDWVRDGNDERRPRGGGWQGADIGVAPLTDPGPGSGPAGRAHPEPEDGRAPGIFRNTYYDFPQEAADGPKDGVVFDPQCKPIASVTKKFHDEVCVQGSGRLSTGETVSFSRRDCECAAVCPRTEQKICFDKLDPARFPSGRGALGTPVFPLRTVAVDPNIVPLGTALFIPEYVGLPRPDGAPHDGCFLAEDKGLKVVGRHVDIFTGNTSVTTQWNTLVPSNDGVHVVQNASQCQHLLSKSD